jgi:uncharacterized damage-inducible protein DinB
MPDLSLTHRMSAYTAWADDVMLKTAQQLSEAELSAPRDALFKSIAGTFDHTLVVAEMFKAHLEGSTHSHPARHLRSMNDYYVSLAREWTNAELAEVITFQFVGGGEGQMTREDILLHLANHATYHRGFVSTLLFPLKTKGSASDLTVFLRDVWPDMAAKRKETGQ